MRRLWTAAEDDLVREHYPRGTAAAVAALPGRTLRAIEARAADLKVSCAHALFDEGRLLAVIVGFAERGDPLIGEKAFAARFGISKTAARNAIGRLVAAGALRIEWEPRQHRAVLADGRTTGWCRQGGGARQAVPRPAPAPVPMVLPERAAAPPPVAFLEHFRALPASPRNCCWPTWPHGAVAPSCPTFCEAASVGEHPYCAAHCAQAYVAPRMAA